MRCKPGISWGYDAPINLVTFNGKHYAIYYEGDWSAVIRCWNPSDPEFNEYAMMKQMQLWNYGTCELCPIVKMEMDWTC